MGGLCLIYCTLFKSDSKDRIIRFLMGVPTAFIQTVLDCFTVISLLIFITTWRYGDGIISTLQQSEIKIKNVHYFQKLVGDVANLCWFFFFPSTFSDLYNVCSTRSCLWLTAEQEHLAVPSVRPHLKFRHLKGTTAGPFVNKPGLGDFPHHGIGHWSK